MTVREAFVKITLGLWGTIACVSLGIVLAFIFTVAIMVCLGYSAPAEARPLPPEAKEPVVRRPQSPTLPTPASDVLPATKRH